MSTYALDIAVTMDGVVGTINGFITAGASCNNSDFNLLAGINNDLGVARLTNKFACDGTTQSANNETIRFGHDLSSAIISLDGNPHISFNSLPSGFRVLTERLSIKYQSPFVTGTMKLDFDIFTVSGDLGVNSPGIVTKTFDHPAPLSPLEMFTSGFGILLEGIGVHPAFYQMGFGKFTGNYDLLTSSITITPNPTLPGTVETVDGDGNLDEITEITIKKPDNTLLATVTTFTTHTPTRIIFIFPSLGGYTGPVVLEGTTFSGSVLLGTLTVLFEDASGIYKLSPTQTHDTIYLASSGSGATQNVKIPNPFAKSGFIND